MEKIIGELILLLQEETKLLLGRQTKIFDVMIDLESNLYSLLEFVQSKNMKAFVLQYKHSKIGFSKLRQCFRGRIGDTESKLNAASKRSKAEKLLEQLINTMKQVCSYSTVEECEKAFVDLS